MFRSAFRGFPVNFSVIRDFRFLVKFPKAMNLCIFRDFGPKIFFLQIDGVCEEGLQCTQRPTPEGEIIRKPAKKNY
ncbi:Catalase-peroxidase [Frankliniella fusca]|uniref:Catalase-peroxidase n=1 Tax=Frankliniella fusca TaxID=407009 RepID=A0AAE1HP31_9NEOP|nr:Catalase-peroxidase [Frankliniella fusca]